jgi:hypothetical protein
MFLKMAYGIITFSELLELFAIAQTERYADIKILKGFVSMEYQVDNSVDKDESYKNVIENRRYLFDKCQIPCTMANFLNELRKGNFYNLVRLRNLIRNPDQDQGSDFISSGIFPKVIKTRRNVFDMVVGVIGATQTWEIMLRKNFDFQVVITQIQNKDFEVGNNILTATNLVYT